MPALIKRIWTDDALITRTKGRGKCELIDGELTNMSPAGYDHDRVALNIASELRQFVRAHKLGSVVGSSAGFRLNPENVLSPDAGYVSREREKLSQTPPGGFFRGVPDLAVEVISPSERRTQIRLKNEKYFAQGTRLIWLVYLDRKQVDVLTSPDHVTTVKDGELNGDVLPGFRLPLKTIFEDWF